MTRTKLGRNAPRRSLGAVPEKYHPSPEERDERVSLPLPPEVAIPAILATGRHPEEDDSEGEG